MNKLVCETIRLIEGGHTYTGRTFLAGSDATTDEIIAHAHRHWGEWDSLMIHSGESVTVMDAPQ